MALQLHDVRDAERLAAAIAARTKWPLSLDDRLDLCQYLLVAAWKLADGFEPERGSFANYCYTRLPLRAIDWYRVRFGRTKWSFSSGYTYERAPVHLLSYDDERDRLDESLAASGGDPADDCDPELERLLGAGDRQRLADLYTLGL